MKRLYYHTVCDSLTKAVYLNVVQHMIVLVLPGFSLILTDFISACTCRTECLLWIVSEHSLVCVLLLSPSYFS